MKKRFLLALVAVPVLGLCLLAAQGCKKEGAEQMQAPQEQTEGTVQTTPEAAPAQ